MLAIHNDKYGVDGPTVRFALYGRYLLFIVILSYLTSHPYIYISPVLCILSWMPDMIPPS